MKVKWISEWEEGAVEIEAELDLKTGLVMADAVECDFDHLLGEYVETTDGRLRTKIEAGEDNQYCLSEAVLAQYVANAHASEDVECHCDLRARPAGEGCQIGSQELAVKIAAAEEKYWHQTCQDCGAMTPAETETKCTCGGDWVIYHPDEPVDARFWSKDDGWTNLARATRFKDMPVAPYPMGGSENTQADALRIGTMRLHTVVLETRGDASRAFSFECYAVSGVHAIEQAEKAHPGIDVISEQLSDTVQV